MYCCVFDYCVCMFADVLLCCMCLLLVVCVLMSAAFARRAHFFFYCFIMSAAFVLLSGEADAPARREPHGRAARRIYIYI